METPFVEWTDGFSSAVQRVCERTVVDRSAGRQPKHVEKVKRKFLCQSETIFISRKVAFHLWVCRKIEFQRASKQLAQLVSLSKGSFSDE